MHSKWVFKHFRSWSSRRIYLLALLWIAGLLTGILLCTLAPYDTVGIFYGVIGKKPSVLGLFFVSVLPVLLFTLAIRSPLIYLSALLMFFSAISHGFCGTAIYIAVGSASWLLRPMLLFSAGSTSVLIWWLLLQNNAVKRSIKNARFAICLSCLVYFIDLFFLSPLVGDITKVL